MYKEIQGDLITLALQGQFDVIVHGCNCFAIMGAGIAGQIAKTFPGALHADRQWWDRFNDDFFNHRQTANINQLGTFSYCTVDLYNDKDQLSKQTGKFDIVNAYTQFSLGRDLSYSALRMCLEKINHRYQGKSIGLPLIGCGIAGGNWDSVEIIIRKYLKDCNVTVVHYKQ